MKTAGNRQQVNQLKVTNPKSIGLQGLRSGAYIGHQMLFMAEALLGTLYHLSFCDHQVLHVC